MKGGGRNPKPTVNGCLVNGQTRTHQIHNKDGTAYKVTVGLQQNVSSTAKQECRTRYGHINEAPEFRYHYVLAKALVATRPHHDRFVDLIHGDCIDSLPYFEDLSVDLVVTDPPYFLDGLDNKWGKGKARATERTTIGGLPVGMKFDPEQGRRLQQFIETLGQVMIKKLKPGAFAIFFSQPRLSHRMAVGLEDAGFEIRDILAWHYTRKAQFKAFSMDHFVSKMDLPDATKVSIRECMGGRKTPQLRPQCESMILAQKPREGTFINNWLKYRTGLMDASISLDGRSPTTVMQVEKPAKTSYNSHLTVKPVPLVEHLIKLFSMPGQVVLDPFLGSGTTAVAAMNTGRSCVGIECRAEYVEIAVKRILGEMP